MNSKCPNCKKAHEHEDFLFEVVCSCGIRYNPFMQLEGGAAPTELAPEPPAPAGGPSGGFQEAASAFQELREFGETMGGGPAAAPAAASSPSPSLSPASSAPAPTVAAPALSGDMIVTSADTLAGCAIDAFLPPISASADLELSTDNPLHAVFGALWQQAKAADATAVVAVRWIVLPSGTKVLASGTPVRVRSGG